MNLDGDSPIPGRTYQTRDPEVTWQAGKVDPKSRLIFGCEYHSMGGYVGPSHRLLNGRGNNETESPLDLVAKDGSGVDEP